MRGANYKFDYFFLMDINLITSLHLYLVFIMHLGNYHLALVASWSLDCLKHFETYLFTCTAVMLLILQKQHGLLR